MGAVVAQVWVSGRLAVACAAMTLALGGCGSSGETHSEELQLSDDEIEAQSARDLALELGISNPPKVERERYTTPETGPVLVRQCMEEKGWVAQIEGQGISFEADSKSAEERLVIDYYTCRLTYPLEVDYLRGSD